MRERPDAPATLRLVSMYAAMRGSRYALAEDLQYAAVIEGEHPGTGALFRAVGRFHARAAEWAVTGGGCRGVLFAASGFPDPAGPWHARASRLAPGARFGYVTGHPAAARMCAVTYAAEATCWAASTLCPRDLLESAEGRSLGRPLQVQFHMLMHHLSAPTCQWMLGEYARMLPPGSSVAMSCWLPGETPQGRELASMIAGAGWPVHAHSEDDLRHWVSHAGLELHPAGITDIRDWGRAVAGEQRDGDGHAVAGIERCWRQRPEGRIVEAVAVKPAA